ncbi:Mitogen-activated protein kinase kinase kinase 4 [Armadillidium vulgare]|nr:Mitogen-activated protein kinase kinase kinase 4 [Armadillidium vulgare]
MGLPYFHTLFLFLASIPLHMMRECLKLRLEQMPKKPSRMSIKQLMTEYKEGIKFAVGVRQKFEKWCRFLVADLPESLANNLEIRKCQAIEELDSNVKKMLEVYLEWLDQFILMLHRETHVAGLQRNFLQEEWCFVQSTCPHVTDGESLAATRFCNIACHMLCSVRDFLDTGLDDMLSDLQASALDSLDDIEDDDEDDDTFEFENDFDNSSEEGQPTYFKKKLVLRCRALQEIIGEARERALRAIALAKMLKLDLEVAIEAKHLPDDISSLFDTLNKTHHVLVKGHSLKNLIIFVPESLVKTPEDILSILQIRVGESSDKYLILLNAPSRTESKWCGQSFTLSLNADCVIALSRVQVSGLMAIVKDGSHLHSVRRILGDAMKEVVTFSCSQIAPHKAVTQSLLDMKSEALQLCKGLEKSLSDMEELVSITKFFPHADEEVKQISHLVRDTLHQGFLFGFEYHKEALRLVSGRQRSELAPMLISLGRRWIKFVRAHYSSGRGSRPRWALPGFEFLILVCDPHNTSEISDSEFKTLRAEVEECREYIIGSVTNTDSSSPGTPLMMGRPFKSQSSTSSGSHGSSHVESPSIAYTDSPKFRNPLIKSNQQSFDKMDEPDSTMRENPLECVREAVYLLERRLEEQRFREKLIGRVSEHNRDLIEIKPHTVSFSWHRGFKIGE